MENEEIVFKVNPKFNFIYELFMPTGKKFKTNLFGSLLFLGIYFIFNNFMNLGTENISPIINNILLILSLICFILFVFNLIFQIIQYHKMTYIFYKDRIIYEDTFLNQHKKEVVYSDIKEVEIKRKIWDRINNRGVIMIYSNAEKKINNGIIMFAIKDTEKVYNKIREIINNK